MSDPRRFCPTDEVAAITPDALERAWPSYYDDDEPPRTNTEGDVSVVTIAGPLESTAGWWWDGYRGPHGIVARFKSAMLDPATKAVALVVSSPGGTCSGLLEALDDMRAAKTKPVVAFSEGGCYSAAYTLAMVADKVVVSRASGVGSVGVIAMMVSYADQLAREGIAVAVVASGSQKADGHPALTITDAAKARLRARVNELAGLIADEVAKTRGMSSADVLGLQAGVFYGQAAVAAKLADEVGTFARVKELARSLAADAAEAKAMKNVRELLGLAADASEADVSARVEALLALESTVAEETGAQGAKALLKLREWKGLAAEAEGHRAKAEELATRERAAYIDDVMAAHGLPASMRVVLERDATRDFAAFQKDFPRPSREELAARAGDAARLGRLPTGPAKTPRDVTAEAEPTDDELAAVRLTRAEWRAQNGAQGAQKGGA